jgi:hypothetical protein
MAATGGEGSPHRYAWNAFRMFSGEGDDLTWWSLHSPATRGKESLGWLMFSKTPGILAPGKSACKIKRTAILGLSESSASSALMERVRALGSDMGRHQGPSVLFASVSAEDEHANPVLGTEPASSSSRQHIRPAVGIDTRGLRPLCCGVAC